MPLHHSKRNVKLALNIFSETNVAALQCISKDKMHLFPVVEGTCLFLSIFIKCWKTVNVKSAWEGKSFNNDYREPIRSNNTLQIDFLKNMSFWLKNWKLSVPITQSLSAQTLKSLIHTTDTFFQLIPYMFET